MRANFIKIPSKRRPSNAVLSQLLSPTAHPLRYAYVMNASKPHKNPEQTPSKQCYAVPASLPLLTLFPIYL